MPSGLWSGRPREGLPGCARTEGSRVDDDHGLPAVAHGERARRFAEVEAQPGEVGSSERLQIDAARAARLRVECVDEWRLASAVVEGVCPATVRAARTGERRSAHLLSPLARVGDTRGEQAAGTKVVGADE